MIDEAAIAEVVTELRSAREELTKAGGERTKAIEALDTKIKQLETRHGTLEESVNETYKILRRPGPPEGGYYGGSDLELRSAEEMCVLRYEERNPKYEHDRPAYAPNMGEIDDAKRATRAMRGFLRHGKLDLIADEDKRSLSAFSFGSSGWIMPPQWSTRILSCLQDKTNVASLMGQTTISSGSIKFPVDNVDLEDAAAFACETECAVNQPMPDLSGLGELEIKADEIRARACATQTMLEDVSFPLETWMIDKFQRAFANRISRAIINGTGINMPMGILNPQSGIPICDTAPGSPEGQFSWQDLVLLLYQLPEQWQPNAVYFMNGRTLGLVMTMSDAAGRPIWSMMPTGDHLGLTVAGKRVQIVSQLPDIAPGSTPVAVGDWQEAYTVVTRRPIDLQRDPFSGGWCVIFKARARIGGGILCPGAARLLRVQ